MKATFTAEGRKKNCIIKLEEIEKISSVHREKNEDNAHFIKNPHIFTYLHRQLLQKVGNNRLWCQKPLNIGNFTVSKDYLKEYKKFDKNMKKAGKWEDINVTITV